MAQSEDSNTVLSVQDLYKSFGAKQVHKGVSFDLRKGEILALFGGSGSGKSVILRSIIGLIRPDRGKIIFENRDIVGLTEDELIQIRIKIGYVFQNGALFDSMTVEDNLAYPLLEHTRLSHDEIRARIREMLKLINLESVEHQMPASLSGGMQKRVGVARAIILRPQIILYDEPTAGLDPFTVNRLLDLMQEIKAMDQEKAAIFVTHDIPAALKVADRVAILHEGKIHVVDTKDNVVKSKDPFIQAFLTGRES